MDSARCYNHSVAVASRMNFADYMDQAVAESHKHSVIHMKQGPETNRGWGEAHTAARPGPQRMAPRTVLVE